MLLTIKTTYSPATDLGYLLQKNPKKHHEFSLPSGKAHVFYSRANENECVAVLLLEIDPVGLVRKKKHSSCRNFSLEQYVNDRPYVASSFLSVAIAKVFHSALKGVCKEKPGLAETPIPLEATIAALPCKSENGKGLLKRLFQPLGYELEIQDYLLNQKHPEWGKAKHYTLKIKKTALLKDLLSHIYVLIPVLDNEKHYWVDKDEIDKLLSHGEGWLLAHPEKDLITLRYLKKHKNLTNEALNKLIINKQEIDENAEETIEEKLTLQKQRMNEVVKVLKKYSVRRIVDLGCGDGDLLKILMEEESSFDDILGVDVSYRALESAKLKLRLDRVSSMNKNKISLIQGSLNYIDERILGYDACTLIEVIEHLDPSRLKVLEHVVFGYAQPKLIIITTPNIEYNKNFEILHPRTLRHLDHRFEWTRKEFQSWAHLVAGQYGYIFRFQCIGAEDEKVGPPTQMGVFIK
jgi:3' terminal RNA ribose 2'-O-methyltransferase Hen1